MINKRKVVFRADGSSSIGMGHFTRTLALAEMLNQHFYCIYATRKPSEYQIYEIQQTCHDKITLPEDDSHFEVFLDHLNGTEIVVLDNYYFTTDYQRKIKAKGCNLVCIDDMHDKHYVADVVINHAPGISSSDFSIDKKTKLLLGPGFSLVRELFRKKSKYKRQKVGSPQTILIFFGGSDLNNLTCSYLKEIISYGIFKKINCITGDGYLFLQELNDFLFQNKYFHVKHFHNVSAKKVIQISDDSDLAIVPASTVLFEMLAINIPVISGYYIENQKDIYQGFSDMGVVIGIGDLNSTSNLKSIIDNITVGEINCMLEKQRQIFDSETRVRILKVFSEL